LDDRTVLIASFGFGVALQALLLMRGDWNWWKLAGCVAMGLMGLAPGKHESVYQPLFHVLMVFSLFSVMFAFMFKEDILPIITEAILLWYTIVFWYAFYTCSYFSIRTPLDTALVVLLLLPTAATLYIVAVKTQCGFVLKLGLYSWFLVIIVCLGLLQFPFSQLKLFFKDHQVPWVTPFESVTAGMAFLFLLANAAYVYYLIPIPGKGQSLADRMKEWHEFTDLLTQRFDDAQVPLVQVAIALGVGGTALLLNAIYRWFPPEVVINVAIVIPAIVFHPKLLGVSVPESKSSDVVATPRHKP
jgi:hypothetical protein